MVGRSKKQVADGVLMRKYGCWDRVGSSKTRVGKLVVDLGYLVTTKGN